ncbi:MAG: glucosamine-6-phosphate deaminase [Lachnospiraceae bacterium]|nr:glucosamine-6-phosphate deaminase [Lachnospiraceae bacterium]
MRVLVVKDAAEAAKVSADIIEKIVREEPECTLGLATGSSPVGMYQELARRCADEGLDFSKIHSVNLDEYVGLEPTHDQSYRYFMNDNLFDHINIDKANTYVAKGTGDIEENLKEFNAVLDKTDIRIQVLGVGPDGHLGFNEPGAFMHDGAHMEILDESTIEANKRFFASKEDVPTKAVTMGMGNIMRAQALLMVIGGHKPEAASRLLMEDKIDPMCPATFMRMHRDATVVIEEALAKEIGYIK